MTIHVGPSIGDLRNLPLRDWVVVPITLAFRDTECTFYALQPRKEEVRWDG